MWFITRCINMTLLRAPIHDYTRFWTVPDERSMLGKNRGVLDGDGRHNSLTVKDLKCIYPVETPAINIRWQKTSLTRPLEEFIIILWYFCTQSKWLMFSLHKRGHSSNSALSTFYSPFRHTSKHLWSCWAHCWAFCFSCLTDSTRKLKNLSRKAAGFKLFFKKHPFKMLVCFVLFLSLFIQLF